MSVNVFVYKEGKWSRFCEEDSLRREIEAVFENMEDTEYILEDD